MVVEQQAANLAVEQCPVPSPYHHLPSLEILERGKGVEILERERDRVQTWESRVQSGVQRERDRVVFGDHESELSSYPFDPYPEQVGQLLEGVCPGLSLRNGDTTDLGRGRARGYPPCNHVLLFRADFSVGAEFHLQTLVPTPTGSPTVRSPNHKVLYYEVYRVLLQVYSE